MPSPGSLPTVPVDKLADYASQVIHVSTNDMSIAMRAEGDKQETSREYGKLSKDKLDTVSRWASIATRGTP